MTSAARTRVAGILLALLVVAGACAGDDSGGGETSLRPVERDERDRRDDRDEEEREEEQATAGLDLDDIPVEDHDDAIIRAALGEVEVFWETAFPDLYGGSFVPVGGGFVAYGPDREQPFCGGPLVYEQIAMNAFYCPGDDVIAWDTDNLTNDMLERFGAFSLAIVMAHEYGHAIQARAPVGGTTIALEQQADCFAGAFAAFVETGQSDVLALSVDDLDSAVAGFLELRDAVGTPASDPAAHGSAFDRVGAFQDGFFFGAARCVEYEEIYDSGGSTVIDLQFTDVEDFQSGGNAPFDPAIEGNIFQLTLGSLETFWLEALPARFDVDWEPLATQDEVVAFDPADSSSLPTCPGADVTAEDLAGEAFTCFGDPDDPTDDFVALDVNIGVEQYEEIGDFALAALLGQQYSLRAQVLLGNLDVDRVSLLQADCFTGAWAGEVTFATINAGGQAFPPELGFGEGVSISAGDLDEVVQSFLLLGERADDEQGSPFERVAAFRDGFRRGLPSCERYLEDGAPDEREGVPSDDG